MPRSNPPKPVPQQSLAAFENETGKVRLLNTEALNVVDEFGNSLLIWACDSGSLETVEYLLSCENVNANHRGYLGNTALNRASRNGHSKCVEALLKCERIDCNIANDKSQYPLHFAAFFKHADCVQAMIDSGKCDYTVKDSKGRIPAEDTKDEAIRDMLLAAQAAKE